MYGNFYSSHKILNNSLDLFNYLDTMRPICLPLLGEEDADLDGFKMVATGWGKTHDGNIFINNILLIFIGFYHQFMPRKDKHFIYCVH